MKILLTGSTGFVGSRLYKAYPDAIPSETTKSMYEITEEFLEILKVDLPIKDVPARHNLWMNCSKARRSGVMIGNVMDGLRKCIEDYHLYNIVTDQKTNSTMF